MFAKRYTNLCSDIGSADYCERSFGIRTWPAQRALWFRHHSPLALVTKEKTQLVPEVLPFLVSFVVKALTTCERLRVLAHRRRWLTLRLWPLTPT